MPSDRPPFPDSLCHQCRWLRTIKSGRGSVFLMCTEPRLPKYSSQPVRKCAYFRQA